MKLRSRIPVLLSQLIAKGVRVEFGFHVSEPVISWKYPNGDSGHYHFDSFMPGFDGANAIVIEHALSRILEELP